MLTAAQVIPFLSHKDAWVRHHAVDYLSDAEDPSPATADDLWAAIDALDSRDSIRLYRHIEQLPATPRSIERLMTALRQPEDERTRDPLLNALAKIPFALIEQFLPALEQIPGLPPTILEHLRKRLQLAQEPPETAWEQLMRYGIEAETRGLYISDLDIRLVDRLIEAAARSPDSLGGRTLELLRDPTNHDWRELFGSKLVGEMRFRPAIDVLIEKVADVDADLLCDWASDALVKIGGVEVVDRVAAKLTVLSWDYDVYAAPLLGRMKRPESEAHLLRFLPLEDLDADVVAFVGEALCQLCPTNVETLEAVRKVILEDRYDPMMLNLPASLLAAGAMVDWQPPEAEQWRASARKDHKQLEEIALNPDAFLKQFDPERQRPEPEPPMAWESSSNRPVQTIRRTEPKIGRNDPCPCGSGKKYKKCCGANN